jgi:glycerophosphoryl diester phosphodiesterase
VSSPHRTEAKMTRFIIVGHRGASAYIHENTIVSFEEAIARRADMIEFDLRRTADGVIVLLHDRGIQEEAGQMRLVSKITYEELAAHAKNQGFELARFEEVLKSFGPRIPLNIEIKISGFEDEIVRLLRAYPPAFEPTLSSFLPWVVVRLKRLGNFKTALIMGQGRMHKLNILERRIARHLGMGLGISSIHLQDSIVSEKVVNNLVKAGLTVFVWTVDDPEQMRKFIRMGVDGIITNKPDLLYEVCLEMADAREPILKRITNNFGKFAYAV